MLERERQRLILKTAEERSVVSVTDLCDLLGPAYHANRTTLEGHR